MSREVIKEEDTREGEATMFGNYLIDIRSDGKCEFNYD